MKSEALLLIAEDDPDDQYFFQEAMAVVRPEQVETRYAWDGAQLIRMLRESARQNYRRNLVILDLNMRVKDGRTTLHELRADPAFAGIPVIVLTTSDSEEDAEYCRQHGATFVRKPSSIVELVQIVRMLSREYLH